MDHSVADARANLRKRFRSWAYSSFQRLVSRDVILLLLDEEGVVVAREPTVQEDGRTGIGRINPGMKWSADADNAISRSLATKKAEKSVHLAAAPIGIAVGGHRYWLGLYDPELPGEDAGKVFSDLLESIEFEFVLLTETRAPDHLRLLLEMMRSFQGIVDANEVLKEATGWMERKFPGERYHFLLSQDMDGLTVPVKPLVIRRPHSDLCSRAFIEGRSLTVISENTPEGSGIREIAAPLKGKQGIYGVLHVVAARSSLDEDDGTFIAMLAENTGAAFEIARLYEQSTTHVNELRIINNITKRLNRSLQTGEVLQFASNELISIFSADYCCLLQIDKEKRHLVVQASNAEPLLNEKFDIHYGFAGIICRSREPVIISDYQAAKHVESKLMSITAARSLIGSPVIANGETTGAILLVHRLPNFFSYDDFKLLHVISGHIGLALTNADLHAEMRRMVITDQLTGLYVRHYLYEQIRHLQKRDLCGSLIVVDIDNFKLINDTFGHQTGDRVLIQTCQIIGGCIREGDIAARWGGEELAVYLPRMKAKQAYRVADKIRNSVAGETMPQVTVSCGVADWSKEEGGVSVDTLFHRADMALYIAKNSGKNQIRLYRN